MKKFLSFILIFIIVILFITTAIFYVFSRRYDIALSNVDDSKEMQLIQKYQNISREPLTQHFLVLRNVSNLFDGIEPENSDFNWFVLTDKVENNNLLVEYDTISGVALKNLPLDSDTKETVLDSLNQQLELTNNILNTDENLLALQNENIVCKMNFFQELYCGPKPSSFDIDMNNEISFLDSTSELYKINNPIYFSKLTYRPVPDFSNVTRDIHSFSIDINNDTNLEKYLNFLGFNFDPKNSAQTSTAKVVSYVNNSMRCQILMGEASSSRLSNHQVLTCGIQP